MVVFNEELYGAAVTAVPTLTLSTLNCTLATATLSVALAVTVTVPETVALAAGDVIDTVGGVVSVGAVVLAVFPLTRPEHPARLMMAAPSRSRTKFDSVPFPALLAARTFASIIFIPLYAQWRIPRERLRHTLLTNCPALRVRRVSLRRN